MMRRLWAVIVLVCSIALAFLDPASAQAAVHRKLTIAEAKELALASLTPEQLRLPKLGAEPDPIDDSSRYLFVTVTWTGEPNGSVVVENFAVDISTGDVWSATTSCLEEKNAKLNELQLRLRKRLGLSSRDYQTLKTKGPLCEE